MSVWGGPEWNRIEYSAPDSPHEIYEKTHVHANTTTTTTTTSRLRAHEIAESERREHLLSSHSKYIVENGTCTNIRTIKSTAIYIYSLYGAAESAARIYLVCVCVFVAVLNVYAFAGAANRRSLCASVPWVVSVFVCVCVGQFSTATWFTLCRSMHSYNFTHAKNHPRKHHKSMESKHETIARNVCVCAQDVVSRFIRSHISIKLWQNFCSVRRSRKKCADLNAIRLEVSLNEIQLKSTSHCSDGSSVIVIWHWLVNKLILHTTEFILNK